MFGSNNTQNKKQGGFMKLNRNLLVALAITVTAVSSYAQDSKKDHPALSRYKGAEIAERDGKIAYNQADYAPYVLGIDNQERENVRGFQRYFKEYIDLEGKLTRIQYKVDKSEGLFKVFKNYKMALKDAGYKILFETSEKESSYPFWNEDVYHRENGINAIKGGRFKVPFGRAGFRYIAAKGVYKGNNIYFAIMITQQSGNILITQDIIEVNPMESGLVTAKKIKDNIKLSGFVSIYGVHFDTGKWNIKEKSKPALKEIASFLKRDQENKYFIVGHTDNTGKFSSNMTLSENRAKAVMNALINDYGVKAEQLDAYGVSSLSPVTSNSTDEGKARNRRVEIVEQ